MVFFFFRWKIEIYFIEWTPSVIFSRVAAPLVKILPMVFTRWNKFPSFTEKKQIFCLFHAFNPFSEKLYQNPVQFFSVIPCGVPLLHSKALQYFVKREICKVNDVIFPSGCETRAINLGNKNIKTGIFIGATRVRSKNIFTDISRYSTGKHEINIYILFTSNMHRSRYFTRDGAGGIPPKTHLSHYYDTLISRFELMLAVYKKRHPFQI